MKVYILFIVLAICAHGSVLVPAGNLETTERFPIWGQHFAKTMVLVGIPEVDVVPMRWIVLVYVTMHAMVFIEYHFQTVSVIPYSVKS